MRRLLPLLAAAALTTALAPGSANAAPAVLVFTGNAHVDCFGCAVPTPCYANIDIVVGTHTGPMVTTSCTAFGSGALCLVAGDANGTIVGTSGTAVGLTLNFNWTRVGVVAVITVSGSTTGAGTSLLIAPAPSCGAPANLQVAGTVVGV